MASTRIWRLRTVLVLLLAACASQREPLRLPEQVDGGWKLTTSEQLSQIPDLVRELSMRSALAGRYQGPSEIRVSVYEMTADASAFELRQKIRPPAKGVAVHKERCYIEATSDSSRDELLRFIAAFERTLVCLPGLSRRSGAISW